MLSLSQIILKNLLLIQFFYFKIDQIKILTFNQFINQQLIAHNQQAMQQQDQILKKLSTHQTLHSQQLQKQFNISHEALYSELVSLNALNYIKFQNVKVSKTVLTKEGELYANEGTPEAKIFNLSTVQGTPKDDIEKQVGPAFKIGLGNAMKKKIIVLKDNLILKAKQAYIDEDQKLLLLVKQAKLEQINKNDLKTLKQRKLVQQKTQTHFIISKGPEYQQQRVELVTDFTSAMIADGSWEQTHFKKFNPDSKGAEIDNGNLHILMKTKQQFIQILTEMGFQEMQTDRYVESSFWNFDALFQPQAHPARDAHDTFFISEPKKARVDDKEYFEKVKNIHEKGGYGSLGYDYEWDPEEAYKNLLRTHTTAVSSRVLKSIAEEKPFRPRKFFSIDRVFRNETLDNTHLAEFHQVEGFIIDRNLGLHHLIGVLTEFYKKIGIENIRFKPTYNPYTQPSMQIFDSGVHPILKKNVQIGNSGIFRPQMIRPMGFPQDVSVIAWGLSLERPTMIQFGVSNIKELFGPGVSLKKIKESGIYCL